MDHVQNRSSLTASGTILLAFVYGGWLITLPPFSWYDSTLMWFYGWALDWGRSIDGGFLGGVYFIVDMVFVYLKYFLIANIIALWACGDY